MLLVGIQSAFSEHPNPAIFEAMALTEEDGKAQYNLAVARSRSNNIRR